jgi:hypothetical protein
VPPLPISYTYKSLHLGDELARHEREELHDTAAANNEKHNMVRACVCVCVCVYLCVCVCVCAWVFATHTHTHTHTHTNCDMIR